VWLHQACFVALLDGRVSHICSNIDKLKIIDRAPPQVLAALAAAGMMNLLGLASACMGIGVIPQALLFGLTDTFALASAACLCVLGYLLAGSRERDHSLHSAPRRNLEDLGSEGAPPNGAEATAEVAPTGQDAFLAEVDRRLIGGSRAGLVAVVRVANFDKVAAFDHQVARLAAQRFGERLRIVIRTSGASCQLERDSFAIWLPSVGASDTLSELRAIAYALAEDIRLPANTISPDVRLGCAVSPRDGTDAATLLANASAAVPDTPSSDATMVSEFTAVTAASARRTFLIEQGLHGAIAGDQLVLKYQPVVDVVEKRIVGAEALLRWLHPELGQLSPTEFVPVLEQSTMIDEVGSWVLNTACREARSWRRQGFSDLSVAVNVSARQFRNLTLPKLVEQTLANHGLAAAALEIELTETAALEESARTHEALQHLRALGVGVAIDDFGVGFSSLSYLKNLPLTKLKIDREFVIDVHQRPDSRAICSALIALAEGLKIRVLAEGVEKIEEVEALIDLGCTTFQGFFFFPPLTADDFARQVLEGEWAGALDASVARSRERADEQREGKAAESIQAWAQ
jgi:EAL domain-containing protein (putative c-di-GMP-specific phosphodiesterase class I)/GGDEF domain-containing protein